MRETCVSVEARLATVEELKPLQKWLAVKNEDKLADSIVESN